MLNFNEYDLDMINTKGVKFQKIDFNVNFNSFIHNILFTVEQLHQ